MRRVYEFALMAAMVCGAAVLLPACDDDTETPPPGTWEEAVIAGAPAGGAMFGIAFSASRGLAAGAEAQGMIPFTYTPFLAALQGDGTWAPAAGPTLPQESLLTAVGFTSAGDAVVAGAGPSAGGGFILDERGGWSRHDVALGALSFAADGGVLRFAGSGGGHAISVSSAADTWAPEYLPFPAVDNERALEDIAARNGVWAACGYDDGGEGTPESPNGVIFMNDGSGWERLDAPCGGCSNREFKTVAVAANGAILLGGAVTDFSGGANEYTAFLLLRSASGEWAEIVLPGAGALDRVNDILIAANGDAYLGCGVTDGAIVRWPTGGAMRREATLPSSRIFRLAEAADGTIWAAGSVIAGFEGETRPAIWKRTD